MQPVERCSAPASRPEMTSKTRPTNGTLRSGSKGTGPEGTCSPVALRLRLSAVFKLPPSGESFAPRRVHLALIVLCFSTSRLRFDRLRHEMAPRVIPFGVVGRLVRRSRPVTECGRNTHRHVRCFGILRVCLFRSLWPVPRKHPRQRCLCCGCSGSSRGQTQRGSTGCGFRAHALTS
jgi:hypothetical protein